MDTPIQIRRISPQQAPEYRVLRLAGLEIHPEAFGSSFAEEEVLSEAAFSERLSTSTIFGAWQGEELIGCVGLAQRDKTKLQHKAVLWGMFVLPETRRLGVGKQLLGQVLTHAQTCCDEVLLTVVEDNDAATYLYTAAGFELYGREPNAIKIEGNYHHELLMRLPFHRDERQSA